MFLTSSELSWTNMFQTFVSTGSANFREFVHENARPRICHGSSGLLQHGIRWCTSVTDKLQRVLNAAARLVCGTSKYDQGLAILLHADLHLLDVADWICYKVAVTHSPPMSAR